LADRLNIHPDSLFTLLVVIVVILMLAGLGVAGYFIAARRVKQPFLAFLARYGISFLCLFLLEFALLSFLPSFHTTMRNLTATLVSRVLSLAGVSHTVSASTIMLQNPSLAFNIDVACLGGLLLWVYTALVLAESKATLKQRLAGILAGLAILLGFNIFRITLSIYLEWATGVYVHNYFYIFNMVFVLLVWAGWLRISRAKAGRPAQSMSQQGTTNQTSHASLE
jgi:exosortase/archaeosortase family protein